MSADYYRGKLRGAQAKDFYDSIITQIDDGNLSGRFELSGDKWRGMKEDAINAMIAVKLDRPDFFFFGREYRATQLGSRVTLSVDVLYTKTQITRIKKLLDSLLDKLTSDTDGLNELEREKLVYKRVAFLRNYKDSGIPEDHNVVGPVLNKTAVCEGYSALLALALRRARIRCICVSGKGGNEDHSWNVVWCCGVPCHVDVTWESVLDGDVGYFYFNLSDAEIGLDHTVNPRMHPPCQTVFEELKGVRGFGSGKEGMHHIIGELAHGNHSARVEIRNTDDLELWIKRAVFFSPPGSYRYTIDPVHKRALVVRERKKRQTKRKET